MNTISNGKSAVFNKIFVTVLLCLSAVFNILYRPVFNRVVTMRKEPLSLIGVSTFSSFLFIIFVLLMVLSLFLKKKYRIHTLAMTVLLFMQIYTIISLTRSIAVYSQYEWLAQAVRTSVLLFIQEFLFLAIFVFFLVDTIKAHQLLNASKILTVLGVAIASIVTLFGFVQHYILVAICASWTVFLLLAMLIYYFKIVQPSISIGEVEKELIALKEANQNGNLSDDEYTIRRKSVLNLLNEQINTNDRPFAYNYGKICVFVSIAIQIISLIVSILTSNSNPALSGG